MGVGDLIRKIVSFALLIAAGFALVGFFVGAGTFVFDPIVDACKPFDIQKLGVAMYNLIEAMSLPLIMIILGLIGLTVDK